MSEYYISHHGIKGMKWGVRRYQAPDGSYTAAGRARYFSKGGDVKKYDKAAVKDYDKRARDFYTKNDVGTKARSHTQQVSNKVAAEMRNTKEWKQLHYLESSIADARKKSGAKGMILDQQSQALYNRTLYAYQKRAKSEIKKHEDEYASAVLKDIGYKDESLGREYIKKTKTFRQLMVS